MAFTALITLAAAGSDTGPFNLYSDVDSYTTPFETGVAKSALLDGYTSSLVPTDTLTIRVNSESTLCNNYVDMSFAPPPATYTRIDSPGGAYKYGDDTLSCGGVIIAPTAIIYLNATDYLTWSTNGTLLAEGMVLYTNGSGTVATYLKVYDPLAMTIYNVNTGVVGTVPAGGFC